MFTVGDAVSFASQSYLLTFIIAILLATLIKLMTRFIQRLNKVKVVNDE